MLDVLISGGASNHVHQCQMRMTINFQFSRESAGKITEIRKMEGQGGVFDMCFPYGRCARSLVAVFTNDAQSMRCHRIVSGSFSTQTEQRRLAFCQPWKRLLGRLIFFKLRLGLDKISRIFRAVEINCRCWKNPYMLSQSKRWHDNYSSNISL